ncbi:MAG: hypothetical protein ACO1SV_24115 [Fimbriimonas sp.]
MLALQAKIAELTRHAERLEDRLVFESDKNKDFENILSKAKIVDFSAYDLASDAHWKLLFDYNYFHAVTRAVAGSVESPVELRQLFELAEAHALTADIAWHSTGDPDREQLDRNPSRSLPLTRKMLRRFRNSTASFYLRFVQDVPKEVQRAINEAGRDAVARIGNKVFGD